MQPEDFTHDKDLFGITHEGGVHWHEAPLPPKRHKCRRQSWGFVNPGAYVERCACGAIRLNPYHPWMERNRAANVAGRVRDSRVKLALVRAANGVLGVVNRILS